MEVDRVIYNTLTIMSKLSLNAVSFRIIRDVGRKHNPELIICLQYRLT